VSLPDIIRVPNHLGDLIMALPALAAAPDADIVVARWLLPITDMLGRASRVIPLDRGTRGLLRAAGEVRRRRCGSGVLLPPSFSSALLFRLGGVRHIRGTATDGRRLLLSDAVPVTRIRDRHRTLVYHDLVTGSREVASGSAAEGGSGAGAAATAGVHSVDLSRIPRLRPRLPVPAQARERWEAELRRLAGGVRGAGGAGAAAGSAGAGGAAVGIFPGSNARSRRWDAERFAALAQGLAEQGVAVLVFGAPSEQAITAAVPGTWAVDLGGGLGRAHGPAHGGVGVVRHSRDERQRPHASARHGTGVARD
jgi:ADP-heptose:LPS heptosyltransferase